ncbi:MAG TPA: Hpt domain-containing protein [Patescibacteria group bacterium]|nr:Hpt domain-containing protein [Gammaproteobacteria bacterium]HWA51514.1 Hpt domain-containing protein [Patescibacteria group bacterium]
MQKTQNVAASEIGESGLEIISLKKSEASYKLAWEIIIELMASLPEVRAEIEISYNARDWEKLTHQVHKLHGGLCYTNTPDMLQATRNLEIILKAHDYNKSKTVYKKFITAMDALEKLYYSIQK